MPSMTNVHPLSMIIDGVEHRIIRTFPAVNGVVLVACERGEPVSVRDESVADTILSTLARREYVSGISRRDLRRLLVPRSMSESSYYRGMGELVRTGMITKTDSGLTVMS